MILEDPLNLKDLEVTDVASARYALKVANDQHFAILHMRENMMKELQRSQQEIFNQKWLLISPYLQTDSPVRSPYIPNPLPETVPANVAAAFLYLDEQYNLEVQRAEAELNEETTELYNLRERLMELASAWFISEIQAGANWLVGNRAVIGGCTLTYSGGSVSFDFEELNYD